MHVIIHTHTYTLILACELTCIHMKFSTHVHRCVRAYVRAGACTRTYTHLHLHQQRLCFPFIRCSCPIRILQAFFANLLLHNIN